MKFLLTAINSKYIHSNPAVYALKASAGEHKERVCIREFTINNLKEKILKDIYTEKPGVLFFSVYIWNIEYVKAISKEFHKLCPTVPIWAGGPEVSYETEDFLAKNPQFSGVMIGEGEESFREVCKYYQEGGCLDYVSGIAFRRLDKVVFTPIREPIDLSSTSFAYENIEDFKNKIIYYETSRGCPFSCSYCLSSVDKKLRFKNIEKVKEELKYFLEAKVPQVKFVDRTFNCNHEHALEIWKFIRENDNGVTNFHFEISADLINESELEVLKSMRPGLVQLEIGVQTTNQDTLKEIHRHMDLKRLKAVVNAIHSFGNIHQHLDLIAGLPYEDISSFINSFNEVYELKPHQLQLGFLKVLKGSYMYEHYKDYGVVFTDSSPYEVMSTKWISFSDILRLKRVEEMVEVYFNSHQFEKSIEYLEKGFDNSFAFFDALGDFYEEKGYFDIAHSRIRRAEILLEFADTRVNRGILEMLKEACVYDIYVRENSKTRPSFANDFSLWKDVTEKYCQKGKMSHVEQFSFDLSGDGKKLETPMWMYFDYEKRNPISGNVEVTVLN